MPPQILIDTLWMIFIVGHGLGKGTMVPATFMRMIFDMDKAETLFSTATVCVPFNATGSCISFATMCTISPTRAFGRFIYISTVIETIVTSVGFSTTNTV